MPQALFLEVKELFFQITHFELVFKQFDVKSDCLTVIANLFIQKRHRFVLFEVFDDLETLVHRVEVVLHNLLDL